MPDKIPRRALGDTGMEFTSIGLGTWMMETEPRKAVAALRLGIEEGANHIDTAEMYGDGRVEEIVGKAVRGMREKVFLVSKVLPSHARHDDVLSACERSLRRLRTDRLDVYLLHWRERSTPVEETFRAFEKLREDGKIRAWGVSNFNVKELTEAVRLAGNGRIACNQVLYHLTERAIEFDVMPWCRARGIAVVAYSPLGQGRLPAGGALRPVAERHGLTPAQVALAFLARDDHVIAIPKSSGLRHTRENVRAARVRLSQDEIASIDRAFPARRRRALPTI